MHQLLDLSLAVTALPSFLVLAGSHPSALRGNSTRQVSPPAAGVCPEGLSAQALDWRLHTQIATSSISTLEDRRACAAAEGKARVRCRYESSCFHGAVAQQRVHEPFETRTLISRGPIVVLVCEGPRANESSNFLARVATFHRSLLGRGLRTPHVGAGDSTAGVVISSSDLGPGRIATVGLPPNVT